MPYLLIVIILIALYAIFSYNGLVRLRNQANEAFATMDVYLKKRFDLVPNLVEVVKKYASHEQDTLMKLTDARTKFASAGSPDEKVAAENELSGGIKNIIAVAENYPELKSNENFMALQTQLGDIENDIAQSRKYYNAVIKALNSKIEMFPTSFIASAFHFVPRAFFAVDNDEQRQNVKVEL